MIGSGSGVLSLAERTDVAQSGAVSVLLPPVGEWPSPVTQRIRSKPAMRSRRAALESLEDLGRT